MGYTNHEDHKKYHREYMKERRAWLKQHHFCSECGKQDAYTLGGRAVCYECNAKHSKPSVEQQAVRNQKNKDLRKQREKMGLCTNCGSDLPPNSKYKMCSICRFKAKLKKRKQTPLIFRGSSFEKDICYICQKQLDGQKRTWSVHDERSRLCSKCYAFAVNSAAKGRQNNSWYLEPKPPFVYTEKAVNNYWQLKNSSKAKTE